MMIENLQLVLSSYETRYSDLSIFLSKEENEFYIYIGVALLERISTNAEEIGHKMFIGRLYNSGVKLCILRDRFKHDVRSIKKWENALKSFDIDEIYKAFSGRKAAKKTTPELIRYVLQQYDSRSLLGRSYREKIKMGVEDIFSIRLSSSLLSRIFRSGTDKRPICSSELNDEKMDIIEHSNISLGSKDTTSVQQSPILSNNYSAPLNGEMIHHAGLILFEKYLNSYSWFQRQVICQILSGAVNIEQSKTLCFEGLSRFCPELVKTLRDQRQLLDKSATLENELELYRLNSFFLSDGPGKGKVYYFDPHSKHYTGILKVLKGWCGSLHSISKIINLDCFHTESGRPCFIQHYSSYYDMRERFFISLALFDKLFAPEKCSNRTFVIDRGIFGVECFRRFENDYLITWEKGFKSSALDEAILPVKFTRYKNKNGSSGKKKKYFFECNESPWSKMNEIRRIIVKATNDNGRAIIVSVLCSNPEMPLEDVVWLIFNRWLQENDFKYLDRHFGINQLDSRARDDFKNRMDEFNDRTAESIEYKKLKNKSKTISDILAKNLLKQNRKQKDLEAKQLEIKKLNAAYILPGIGLKKEIQKEFKKAKKSIERIKDSILKFKAEQEALERQLENAEQKQADELKEESRIKQLVDGNYQLIDTRRKAYIDALRINAANIFRSINDEYRTIYDNYRDDHYYLRLLSRACGVINSTQSELTVSLWLPGTIQKHIIRAMEKLTEKLTEEINLKKSKSKRKLKIELLTGAVSA